MKLVSQFNLDLLYPVVEDDAQLAAVVDAFPFLEAPSDIRMHGLLRLIGDDELNVVDVRLLVSHYFETVVRFGGGESRSACPSWSTEDPLAPLYTVVFGDFGTAAPGPRYQHAFLALRADEMRVEGEVPVDLLRRVSPIAFTGDQLTRRPRWPEGHGVVLGDPSDADVLAAFWNLRSIGVSVVFWPLLEGSTFKAYCLEHLKRVTPTPREDGEILGPYLWRQEWPREDREVPTAIKEVFEEVGASPVRATLNDLTWSQPLHTPDVWSTRSRSVLATVEDDRWGRRRMVFPLPEHPYARAQTENRWFSHWIVSLSASGEYDNPGYTLRLPSLPDLNQWASEVIAPVNGVRLNGDGVGIFARPQETSLRFRLPEELDVVRQVLLRAGITAETSSAGEAMNRIIRQMDGLLGCRLFRLPGVRRLLARSPAADRWENVIATIEDEGSFGRYANVSGTAADVFRRLLEQGVFRAGLEMQCPACNIRHRYAPEDLAVEIRCPRCGTMFLLAPRLENSHWEYQASGFFAHHREHGAIPVILTLLRLENNLSEHALFLAPSQRLSGEGVSCESDFVGLHQRHSGDVVVALGECKGGPKKITEQSFNKLVAAADKVRASGLECYLVFATTRPNFEDDEIALFRDYRESIRGQWSLDEPMQGWPRPTPVLFTWRELRSYDAYEGPLRTKLPEQYAMSLRQLSANSAFIYLDEHEEPLPHDEADRLLI